MHITERTSAVGSLLSEVRLAETTVLDKFMDCTRDEVIIVSQEAP